MLIHFAPSQLLWEGEITLFALRNTGIIQALGSVEGAWLPFYARGGTRHVSEAASPCREEVRLPALPKTQFGSLRATRPRRRRRGRWPRGVSVTALAAAAGPCPPRRPARSAVTERGERRPGAAAVAGQTPSGQRCGGARSEAGRNVPRLPSKAAGKHCSGPPLLAAVSCSAVLVKTRSPVFVLKALAVFSLRAKETSRPKTFPKLVGMLSACLRKPPGYLHGFRTNR